MTTMRITTDSEKTKRVVIKAAKSAHLWGDQKGRTAFFRDVPTPTPKKHAHVKRKFEDHSGEDKQKNPKRQRTSKSEPAPRDRSAEEAREEIETIRFVSEEIKKEQLEIEASRASKRRKTVSEDEIGNFLKQQRNRSVERESTNSRGLEDAKET